MENKILGAILLLSAIVLAIVIFTFNSALENKSEASCSCTEMQNGGSCPMESKTSWPVYLGIIAIALVAGLGAYLIFFEKSQKAILSTLEKQKQHADSEEKFNIFLKALNSDEQKIIKAVKEQEGITQQTLSLRTGIHKSKLSILLDALEKKDLITRKEKGKTKQVYIKISI